jgi:hypothetical protein
MLFGESKTLGLRLGEKMDSSGLLEETLVLFAIILHIQQYDSLFSS